MPTVQLPSPRYPAHAARVVADTFFTDGDGRRTLVHWRGSFYAWRTTHWERTGKGPLYVLIRGATDRAVYTDASQKTRRWAASAASLRAVLLCLADACAIPDETEPETWLDDPGYERCISYQDGLLMPADDSGNGDELLPHDPLYFNLTASPCAWAGRSPPPAASTVPAASVHAFLADHCAFAPDQMVSKEDLHAAYLAWAGRHAAPLPHRTFVLAVAEAAGKKVTTGRRRVRGVTACVFIGICLTAAPLRLPRPAPLNRRSK